MLDHIEYCSKEELFDYLKDICSGFVAVIVSKSAACRFGFESILKSSQNINLIWINFAPSNPDPKSICRALKMLRKKQCQRIVAIGGGSAIDFAKILCAFLPMENINNPEDLTDSCEKKSYKQAKQKVYLPITAIPTTAGTGSEVTPWATLWNEEKNEKISVEMKVLVPDKVWIAPSLLSHLPKRVALSTGLDAICQASEAYWAKKTDPFVQALCLKAINIMLQALPLFLEGDKSEKVLSMLATGSLLGGVAFSRTRTTACHSISYPLTSLFGIEHGFAVALTLAPVANKNAEVIDLEPIFNAFDGDISAYLNNICNDIQPLRLSSFGVSREDIPEIAKMSFTAGRMDNNPIELGISDVEKILITIL